MRFSSITITLTATLLMATFVHAAPVGDALKSAGNSVLGRGLGDELSLNGVPDALGGGISGVVYIVSAAPGISDFTTQPSFSSGYANADIGAQNGNALKRRNENEPDENEPDENEPKEDENEPDELGDEAPANH